MSECVANVIFPLFQQQRTVYRLTLVKAWNVDELKAYADLISLGEPDFIEVKVRCTELFYFFPSVFDFFPLPVPPSLKLIGVNAILPKISVTHKELRTLALVFNVRLPGF